MFLHNVLLQTSNSLALLSTNCACFTTKTYADLVFVITRLATLLDWTSAGAGWRALCIFTMRVVGSLHPFLKEDFSSAFFGPNFKLFKISYLMTLIDVKIKLPRGARNCTANILWNHLRVIPLKFYKLVGNSQPPGFRCHMSGIKGQVSHNFCCCWHFWYGGWFWNICQAQSSGGVVFHSRRLGISNQLVKLEGYYH